MRTDPLQHLLERQEGLVALRQAADVGLTRGGLRRALGSSWVRLLPEVVFAGSGLVTSRHRLIAALLHAGPRSVISSLSAAHWYGVTAAAHPFVHVLAPASQHPSSTAFVVVRRTHRPDPTPWRCGPLLVASPARAVVDAARDAGSAVAAQAIVGEAVHRRLVTHDTLRAALEGGAFAASARARRAVAEAAAGASSVPVGELQRLVRSSRALPPVWLTPALRGPDGGRLATPDAWFDPVGVAVQVSFRRPSSTTDQDVTVVTEGLLAEQGVTVLAVTPEAIRLRGECVRAALEQAVARAAYRPRPGVTAVSGRLVSAP